MQDLVVSNASAMLTTFIQILLFGFAFCTILQFGSYGIFKAFRLLDRR